ncbi:hypothetical protein VTN02DRAFT_5352 [Thermoascus thermophilus]
MGEQAARGNGPCAGSLLICSFLGAVGSHTPQQTGLPGLPGFEMNPCQLRASGDHSLGDNYVPSTVDSRTYLSSDPVWRFLTSAVILEHGRSGLAVQHI